MSYWPIGAHGMLKIDVFLPRYFDKFTLKKNKENELKCFQCNLSILKGRHIGFITCFIEEQLRIDFSWTIHFN